MSLQIARWLTGSLSVAVLVTFFLFQSFDFATLLPAENETARFILNKTIRFILNDMFMIGLIYALFPQKRFVLFALLIQVFGLVFVLMPYFILKLYFHASNGPLISFLHRLVLNPTLMALLIPAFWLQMRNEKINTK